jgi:hypothetical protein
MVHGCPPASRAIHSMPAPPRLEALKDAVARHHAEIRSRLDALYRWPIPSLDIGIPCKQGEDSLMHANMRLKRTLNTAWRDGHESRRYEIANWYVARWGGVRKNKPETLSGYVSAPEADLLDRGTAGIATWTKVLVVRDPERYAIFDARVATSLNALQLIHGHSDPILFPNLRNQNTAIEDFQKWLRGRGHDRSRYLPRKAVYPTYLSILKDVAEGAGLSSLDEVEMVLFADAVNLAHRAIAI